MPDPSPLVYRDQNVQQYIINPILTYITDILMHGFSGSCHNLQIFAHFCISSTSHDTCLNGLFGVTAVKCKVSFQEIGIIFTNQSWSNQRPSTFKSSNLKGDVGVTVFVLLLLRFISFFEHTVYILMFYYSVQETDIHIVRHNARTSSKVFYH